jgi:cytochrome c oxidase subunit 3
MPPLRLQNDPFTDPAARLSAGRFGMWLFLLTLAVVFVATIIGYLAVRISPINASTWPPASMPPLPGVLFWSTGALLVSSWTMHRGVRACERGSVSQGAWTLATLVLGVAFLVLQLVAWREAVADNMRLRDHLYAWTFFVLTGLHGAHVVGGLIPLGVVTAKALRGRYGPDRASGAIYCGMYWHFLDAVWIVLYATLWLGS